MNNFLHEPIFDEPAERSIVLGPAPGEELLGVPETLLSGSDAEIGGFCRYAPLTREQEFHLFRKMNCLKYLASVAENEDERQDFLTQASWIRNVIVKHTMRLSLHIVKPYVRYGIPIMELMSEASMWMMDEIVDAYDYRMEDNTFGGFASDRLRKRLWSYMAKRNRPREVTGDYELTRVEDHRRDQQEAASVEDGFEQLRNFFYENIVDDDDLLGIVFRRLGLNDGRIQSTEEIGKAYGITYQAVQKKFDSVMVKLFGHSVSGNFIRSLQGRQKDHGKRRKIQTVCLRNDQA